MPAASAAVVVAAEAAFAASLSVMVKARFENSFSWELGDDKDASACVLGLAKKRGRER